MAENEVQSVDGRVWTADSFAKERGYLLDSLGFAQVMQEHFNVRGYARMQELWEIRDRALKRNRSGSYPEGADIGDLFG